MLCTLGVLYLLSVTPTRARLDVIGERALLFFPAADTDSVALHFGVTGADTLDHAGLDSLVAGADTIVNARDTLARVRAFVPLQGDVSSPWIASTLPRTKLPFALALPARWTYKAVLDSTGLSYRVTERVGNTDVRTPIILDYATYRAERLRSALATNWSSQIKRREQAQQNARRRGLGINIAIPGGSQSAFTTIFGKPEVDLRVSGQANIRAGFDYRKSDQQLALTGRASQLDPEFKQDLRLGITGTIGDKLRIDVNYDSQNQFDFENQLKLQYTGYEDEIIKRIEAGNVFLNTPSSLIRGGQSLFGIKSEFQIGGLYLTTVMSQQEGQANSLDIDAGAETTNFEFKPTDYDVNTHFFLAYYFRNRWEDALADPPTIRVANGFQGIQEIEVWKLEPTTLDEDNVRQAVAVVDLAESPVLVSEADNFVVAELPSNGIDQYDDITGGNTDQFMRNGEVSPTGYLEDQLQLSTSDYQIGKYRKLQLGRDYEIDEILGYISLRQRLQDNEALAVAYRFRANGQTYQVGDFSIEGGGSQGSQTEDRLVLKLIKPINLRQPAIESGFNPAAWYLQLRNIYRFPGRGLNPNEFDLQVYYEPSGKPPSKTLPDVGGRATLLQMLGLDRLNENDQPTPDDLFDYIASTVDPGEGLLKFPYLEPFGSRLRDIIASEQSDNEDELIETYVFSELYTLKPENARRQTTRDVYRVKGSYKGSVKSFYDLRAYAGLVPGSVRVTSGGTPLSEGADYMVDYQGGTVTITNPAYLTSGRDINITYEQNSFVNLQKKTLLGLRADYALDDRLALGATVMRLSQKSPIDKFRIGEEPISNTIWGFDGAFNLEPRWLTRALDALPLIQTRDESTISVTGEFAQLRPGHTETVAFRRTSDRLRSAGQSFSADEQRGISYIDDFESFENTFSLMQPGSWSLASPPDSVGAVDRAGVIKSFGSDSLRSQWRAGMGWYQVNASILSELSNKPVYDVGAIDIVEISEVFPNKDIQAEIDRTLQTFDLYYDPRLRGPYNYTRQLDQFFQRPEDTWGGMVQRLPDGFNDFSLKNIDFIEFIIRPFPENASGDAGASAKLYVDLGSITEDIIPNQRLNNEDGLSLSTISETSILDGNRFPTGTQNGVVDIDDATRRTEDLGLDGLASYAPEDYGIATEQTQFASFLSYLNQACVTVSTPLCQAEVARSQVDPSADDYHYFGNDRFFDDANFWPGGAATVQQRLTRFFAGHELNAFEAQNRLANNTVVKRGNSRFPDSEDRNLNSTVDLVNSYYQYEVPLSRQKLDSLAVPTAVDDYVVGEIEDKDGNGTGWYQVRIPVRQFTRRVGDIQDFSLIESIRVWTTGHEVPITLRFATLELVGSQWQKSDRVAQEKDLYESEDTRLTISSVNNEENSNVYVTPTGTIISQTRLASGRVQNAREQAMVLRVENLKPGQQRAIYRTYNQGLDLLRYSNLRMFAHVHGKTADEVPIESLNQEEGRQKARLFVRLGANEGNDYYEYEAPLTPSYVGSVADELWQSQVLYNGELIDVNSMNIELAALNQLKVARDEEAFPTDSLFVSSDDRPIVDLSTFAPPGAQIGIKGNPSLARITTVVIGIRNPADSTSLNPADELKDATLWVNELRVAGYDESNGWAALVNANIKLADVGRVRANFRQSTAGFGSLSSTLGEREQTDQLTWSISADMNLDKLLPERMGWNIPVSTQVQQSLSTPRFSPQRGDVRLSEILSQVDQQTDLSAMERGEEKDRILASAESFSRSQSITARAGKSGSNSPLARATLDALSVNFSYSESNARSPSQQLNESWRWQSTASYRYIFRRPRTVQLFGFLEETPFISFLSKLQFNYLPQSISFSGTANRNFTLTQERSRELRPDTTDLTPERIKFPFREKQTFAHNRNFALQYNPFAFLNLSFDLSTQQSLNALGVDTLVNVVTKDSVYGASTLDGLLASGIIDSTSLGISAFEETRLSVVPTGEVFSRILRNDDRLRTEVHNQSFNGTIRPRFQNRSMSWLTIQDVSVNTRFSWQNGAAGRNTGASVNNQVDLRTGATIKLQDLLKKIDAYEQLTIAQTAYDRERQQAAQTRQREREQAREAAAADTTGERRFRGGPISININWPNPLAVLRKSFITVTSLNDLSVTYSGSRQSRSSNVGAFVPNLDAFGDSVATSYSLIDAFRGQGAPVGYRFGIDRQIGPDYRIVNSSFQVTDALRDTRQIQGRASVRPGRNLNVSLNWSSNWTDQGQYTYRQVAAMDSIAITPIITGSNKVSVWTFGASYLNFFERQWNTYLADLQADPTPGDGLVSDGNRDGRVVLTNTSLVQDFMRAYTTAKNPIGLQGVTPFPMPNWNVSYSGLTSWPIFRSITQSASLRHAYSGDYNVDYSTNSTAGDSTSFSLATVQVGYITPDYQTNSVSINQRFSPLVGLDMTWKGRIQTNFAWNKANSYGLSTSNAQVRANETSELTLTTSWSKSGMTLPFMGGRKLNNRISFNLTVGRSSTTEERFLLNRALSDAITKPDFLLGDALLGENVSQITAYTRTTISPQISYQFSQTVTANFTMKFERFDSEDSRRPSSTNINGAFNVSVRIQN